MPVPALALLLMGAAGAAGLWQHLPPALLVLALLWLPGRVLAPLIGPVAEEDWGTGRLAVDGALSLAVATAALLPLYVAQAPLAAAPFALAAVFLLLAAASLKQHRRGRVPPAAPASAIEIAAFAAALAALLPVALRHCGGNVDDWWDLAFVQSWLARGHFHFDEPFLHTGQSHPRFLWSVWLALQALVASCTGAEPWRTQAGPWTAAVVTMTVSAFSALAAAVFGGERRLVALSTLMTAVWLWSTEAIPFFTRIYQDKHVAAFALAPVLIAAALRSWRHVTSVPHRGVAGCAIFVGCVATATVSVHSLVYTMAAFATVVAVAGLAPSRLPACLRSRHGQCVAAALALPALYPVAQALRLAMAFGDQGIALANADNPVVRAHLALERILFAGSPGWIVHPGAVFGASAVLAMLMLPLLVRRRRQPAARVLIALTLVPCALLFVPLLAAAAGKLWVPWMLYRLGWLVPVPLLLACGLYAAWSSGAALRAAAVAMSAALLAVTATTATDRMRRDMGEHPFPGAPAPRGAALGAYRFLRAEHGSGRVLAPSGFAELVPALTGKPVVASTERQTLVFSLHEGNAYGRLRDRSEFFASHTTAERRRELAMRHDARWAVLPRRLVATGSEERWLRRYGPEALLAARDADALEPWWSSRREAAQRGLGEQWTIAFENSDYFIARRSGGDGAPTQRRDGLDPPETAMTRDGAARADAERGSGAHAATGGAAKTSGGDPARASPTWLTVLDARASDAAPLFEDPLPRTRGVLASAVGYPGGHAVAWPPPQLLTPPQPIWLGGGEPWEDLPAQVHVRLQMLTRCRVTAVRLIPYIPRLRREAYEIGVDGRIERRQAVHDAPIDMAVADPAMLRGHVDVAVRSLLGNALTLTDIQLLGDPATCEGGWRPHKRAMPMVEKPSRTRLLELAAISPHNGRPLLSLAQQEADPGRSDTAHALLVEATRRDPSLVAAWIDRGFSEDARGEPEAALRSFARAVAADSRSAWAHGCLAWAHIRRGSSLRALWHALRARSLDPYYADSWTLVAYVAHSLRLDAVAERALEAARRIDRERNWPYLARAEFAATRGDTETARKVLREYLRHMPLDAEARTRLAELGAADDATGDARASESGDAEHEAANESGAQGRRSEAVRGEAPGDAQ
ncbi:MAG TPA: tetratricopeptide repeat protein [Candidatus Limnocylindrales bacterium]|nr:tetratricopeptide repeat protein [Candidatus Limnocylindrales bacterium]